MTEETGLKKFYSDNLNGSLPDDKTGVHVELPDFGTIDSEVINSLLSELEAIKRELEQHSKETKQDIQSRALLKIAHHILKGTIPSNNGKATISVEVPEGLVNYLVSKSYLENCSDCYKVTKSGAALADQ